MSRPTHDYDALEREYISTDISVRELAKKHGIASWSTVNEQKKKRGWDAKRADFKEKLASKEIETLVGARLTLVAEIHGELLLAVRHAIRRFIADVSAESGAQAVSARDVMGLIDKFLLLTGQANKRTEAHVGVDGSFAFSDLLTGADPELLRGLAELARQSGTGARPVGPAPLVVLEGTRAS